MLVTFELRFVLLNLIVELKRREEFKLLLQCFVQMRDTFQTFRQPASISLLFIVVKHLNK